MESTYVAPSVVELGTVSELTLQITIGTYNDSAVRGGQQPGTQVS